jgi:hypothetical protein
MLDIMFFIMIELKLECLNSDVEQIKHFFKHSGQNSLFRIEKIQNVNKQPQNYSK